MTNTIRAYVLERLAAGASPLQIWREELPQKFPHKIAGWNYVSALAREFDETKATGGNTDARE